MQGIQYRLALIRSHQQPHGLAAIFIFRSKPKIRHALPFRDTPYGIVMTGVSNDFNDFHD